MSTELATVPEQSIAPAMEQLPSTDLRHAMMAMPVEAQNQVLAAYVERRNNFRRWLREQFEEGLHFGTPPGCGPKGNPTKEQWQHKPSLYAAGADLLCDLLGVRCEYSADVAAWQQLGSKEGYFVIVCRLFSRANGDLVGEGRGVRKEGQKGGDANNALKMAQKAAKVDAVLNTYGLRDLYSQDLEVPIQPPHDNPDADPAAPQVPPRAQRQEPSSGPVSKDQCAHVLAHWTAANPEQSGDNATRMGKFFAWVQKATKRNFEPKNSRNWTLADYRTCCAVLSVPTMEEVP